jgi:hypothetical protein
MEAGALFVSLRMMVEVRAASLSLKSTGDKVRLPGAVRGVWTCACGKSGASLGCPAPAVSCLEGDGQSPRRRAIPARIFRRDWRTTAPLRAG